MTPQEITDRIVPLLPYAVTVARRLVSDSDVAADLVQEMFVRLPSENCRFDGVNAKGFIAVVLRRINADRQRGWWSRGGEHVSVNSVDLGLVSGPPEVLIPEDIDDIYDSLRSWVTDEVRREILDLPDWCRVPFLLHYVMDIPYQDLAEMFGGTKRSMTVRVSYAKTRLQKLCANKK